MMKFFWVCVDIRRIFFSLFLYFS
ncbi:unnamed protein product, partial [Medioppia subpectinata]